MKSYSKGRKRVANEFNDEERKLTENNTDRQSIIPNTNGDLDKTNAAFFENSSRPDIHMIGGEDRLQIKGKT